MVFTSETIFALAMALDDGTVVMLAAVNRLPMTLEISDALETRGRSAAMGETGV